MPKCHTCRSKKICKTKPRITPAIFKKGSKQAKHYMKWLRSKRGKKCR